MSRTFSVKNNKTFFGFGNAKIMTVDEITSLIDDLLIYEAPDDPDEFNQFLVTPLSEVVCIQVGIEGKSGRTFELSYNTDITSYEVRVFTPSTTTDWQIALRFTQTLAQKLGSTIIDEEEIEYAADNITYEYQNDILAGIASLTDPDPELEASTIFGIHHPFCFSQEQLNELKNAENKIQVFDKLVYENQYIGGYFAKQQFYQNDHEIIGAYTLTQQCATILPYQAKVEFLNMDIVSDEQIDRWITSLITFENKDDFDSYERIGELEYSQFIAKLPKQKYHHIDGKYILVEGLSQQEMVDLLNTSNNE